MAPEAKPGKPRVSVVIPSYNRAELLRLAIQSVLDQDYTDFEIIIIDDGSTDNTAEVVSGFNEARIKYFYQENSGLPANARNAGIKRAEADLIAFLDGDDLWYPEKLSRAMRVFGEHPEVDIVCHNYNMTRDGKVILQSSYWPDYDNMYDTLIFKGNRLATSSIVVRRARLFEVGLFSEREDFVGIEDYDLWIKLAKIGCRFHLLADVMSEYVMHSANISGDAERHYRHLLTVVDNHLRILADEQRLDKVRAIRRRTRIMGAAGRDLLKEGHLLKALGYVLKALTGMLRAN